MANLKKALERAQRAATQTEVDTAAKKLKEAMENLDYKKEYKDPMGYLDGSAPATSLELKEKDTLTLFAVPAAIQDMVTVSYESSVPAVATYSDGILTAQKAGTTTLTTIVTAKYDGYAVRYRTKITVKTEEPSKTPIDLSGVTVNAAKDTVAKGGSTRIRVSLRVYRKGYGDV